MKNDAEYLPISTAEALRGACFSFLGHAANNGQITGS